jgi:hypothetical protein
MANGLFLPPIGLTGYARSGKDSLCRVLIKTFKDLHNIEAKRFSIAGDQIRRDLKDLVKNKTDLDIENLNNNEKTLLRPLMVEYGRLMRNTTEGRYFIEQLCDNKEYRHNNVSIITDIRYNEYPQDEVPWLITEQKGLLVYIERDGLDAPNDYEKSNSALIKCGADIIIRMKSFNDNIDLLEESLYKEAEKIVKTYVTTFLQDTSLP